MRRAFRDHNDYLGDPDFVKMPLDMLLSPYYADGLRQSILPDKATPSSHAATSPRRTNRACTPRISRSSTPTATWPR